MNSTEQFLDLYKQLEELAVRRYDYPEDGKAVSNLERRPEYRSIKAELKYCREVRNLLSHRPMVDAEYAVVPSQQMIDLLKATIDSRRCYSSKAGW